MNDDDPNYVTPSFSIPEAMMDELEEIARREDRSVSSVVRRGVRLYRAEHEERHKDLESSSTEKQ